jgi:hypothetical protein
VEKKQGECHEERGFRRELRFGNFVSKVMIPGWLRRCGWARFEVEKLGECLKWWEGGGMTSQDATRA